MEKGFRDRAIVGPSHTLRDAIEPEAIAVCMPSNLIAEPTGGQRDEPMPEYVMTKKNNQFGGRSVG